MQSNSTDSWEAALPIYANVRAPYPPRALFRGLLHGIALSLGLWTLIVWGVFLLFW
jgi:hypothetical protein